MRNCRAIAGSRGWEVTDVDIPRQQLAIPPGCLPALPCFRVPYTQRYGGCGRRGHIEHARVLDNLTNLPRIKRIQTLQRVTIRLGKQSSISLQQVSKDSWGPINRR